MKSPLPRNLILVAILQFIPPMILPPNVLGAIGPVGWAIVLAVFALLGISLLRRQAWSRLATIFVQGFNIIIRILIGVSHAIQGGRPGNPLDAWLLGTFALSIILSGVILYYVDLPDVQVLMQ